MQQGLSMFYVLLISSMSVCIVWLASFLGAALLHAFRLYSVQCLFRSEASGDLRVLVE